MTKSRRPLSLECLESRQLMHADVSLGKNGILLIEADPAGGSVHVSDFSGRLLVNSRTEQGSQTNTFSRNSVKQIVFRGSERDDVFSNNTAIPSTQAGHGGNDNLRGGSARDVIYGGDGHDVIWGGDGNDVLYGGQGNDMLYGGAGHDQIWGGGGHDFLFGEAGDDSLYGGGGRDWLLGGDGNDGLFGGEEFDVLSGGAGADRFLQRDGAADLVMDVRNEDAVIRFQNADATFQFHVTWAAGEFTDREIERVDSALRVLHHSTGNTRLLKTADGTSLTFVRHGAPRGSTNVGGWTDGVSIHLVASSFRDDDWLNQVVFHEVGHNWDDPDENADIGQFRAISGWRQMPANLGIWTSAGQYRRADDNWWYWDSDNFARDYGKTNPLEDFATSFAAYFMDVAKREYSGGDGAAAIPQKVKFVRQFVNSLA